MIGVKWQGTVFTALAWAGITWGQQSERLAPQAMTGSEPTVTVQEFGGQPHSCKLLRSWPLPDGTMGYEVQALDTGEHMTIVESTQTTGAPAPTSADGLRSRVSRIFHWGNSTKPPAGVPVAPEEAVQEEAPPSTDTMAPEDTATAETDAEDNPADPSTPAEPAITRTNAEITPAPQMPADQVEMPRSSDWHRPVEVPRSSDWHQSWGKADDHTTPHTTGLEPLSPSDLRPTPPAENQAMDPPARPQVTWSNQGPAALVSLAAASASQPAAEGPAGSDTMPDPRHPTPMSPGYQSVLAARQAAALSATQAHPGAVSVDASEGNAFSSPPPPPTEETPPAPMMANAFTEGQPNPPGMMTNGYPAMNPYPPQLMSPVMPPAGTMPSAQAALWASQPNAAGQAVVRAGYTSETNQATMLPDPDALGEGDANFPDMLLAKMHEALLPSQREEAAALLVAGNGRTDPRVVEALLQCAQQDPAATVRAACVRGLVTIQAGTEPVIKVLQTLQQDSDPAVRQEAEQALKSLGQSAAK